MDTDKEWLRKIIQEVLATDPRHQGEWAFFDEFGRRLLKATGYQGNYSEALYKVKNDLENSEGWKFV